MIPYILAAIAVLAILGLLAVSRSYYSSQHQHPQNHQEPAASNANAQPPVDQNSQAKPESGTTQPENQHSFLQQFLDFAAVNDRAILALSTLAVAGFTFCLVIANFFLWNAGERHSERQLRGYISAAPDYIFDFSPTQLVTIRYTITNHGLTPAYKVSNAAIVDILSYPLPLDYPFPATVPPERSQTLNPQEFFYGRTTAARLFTASEISDAVTNNGSRIYIFGTLNYVDAFGKKRQTTFCRSAVGSPNLAAVGAGGTQSRVDITYEICDQHNDAD